MVVASKSLRCGCGTNKSSEVELGSLSVRGGAGGKVHGPANNSGHFRVYRVQFNPFTFHFAVSLAKKVPIYASFYAKI